MRRFIALGVAAVVALSTAAPGAAAPAAAIRNANRGGVLDWRVAADGSLLLRAARQRFYRAAFRNGCPELRSARAVRFVTDAAGTLDSFGAVRIDGLRCPIATLAETDRAAWDAAGRRGGVGNGRARASSG